MKILCIGRDGQVARALTHRAKTKGVDLTAKGRLDLNILDKLSLTRKLDELRPDLVINSAAFTNVDGAESEPGQARALNADAPGVVAELTDAREIPLIHLSTDYVFDGSFSRPYSETDPVSPIGVYGHTKRLGEIAVSTQAEQHIILRTAWVYSPYGNNFVKTMLRLAAERDQISVVDDQIGNPTAALDLADAILEVCQHVREKPDGAHWGTFHIAGTGETSWAGLANATFAASRAYDGPSARVIPIPSKDYPTPAERPANSRLDTSKLLSVFGIALPEWQESLCGTVDLTLGQRGSS